MTDQDTKGDVDKRRASPDPHQAGSNAFRRIPEKGRSRDDILREMIQRESSERERWKEGFASGAVYHGDEEHTRFLSEVQAINSQSNPLHGDLWPSVVSYEAQIVSMTANMLGADKVPDNLDPAKRICGTISSGGTESILLAMKTYRDWALDQRGIEKTEIVAPFTAHAAFSKAAQYFGMKLVRVPVGSGFTADVAAIERAITDRTVVVVGSAPSFAQGVVDPIEELSELARSKGIGFHTDACLGGFLLPWAERLGYRIPPFDFRLPGVTSMSADTHKYGYAAKGSSVVLYRGTDLRRYQYSIANDWPGGLYATPTFAGSRAGAVSAACWAAMISLGEEGYLRATKAILETTAWIREKVVGIGDLRILGESVFVVCFSSDAFDIYRVMEFMRGRKWELNGLCNPACLHLCVTLRHTQPGVAQRLITDLADAVDHVKMHPGEEGPLVPLYGMASKAALRGQVADALKDYLDRRYEI